MRPSIPTSALAGIALSLAACASPMGYETLQSANREQCRRLYPSDYNAYADCVRRANISYPQYVDEYNRARSSAAASAVPGPSGANAAPFAPVSPALPIPLPTPP